MALSSATRLVFRDIFLGARLSLLTNVRVNVVFFLFDETNFVISKIFEVGTRLL